jgi:hypothetical protein
MLQVIRRVLPICQDITYSFCFTEAETEIHKIKDDSKIIIQTNLDRRGLRPIPIICHLLDPPLSCYRLPLSIHILQLFLFVSLFQKTLEKIFMIFVPSSVM